MCLRTKGASVSTTILGVGNIGGAVARHLVGGGEPVVLAARDVTDAKAVAERLGPLARAASTEEALAGADAVVLAVWLDPLKSVLEEYAVLLEGKIIVDPTNPVGYDAAGQMTRTLPEGQSSGSLVAALLPESAHYVKAFGTLVAGDLAALANRAPKRAVLFYATDDDVAEATVERLIGTAGFDPLKVGGVADAWRIEVPGGDLQGAVLDLDQARDALTRKEIS
jgi:hypothetical protein